MGIRNNFSKLYHQRVGGKKKFWKLFYIQGAIAIIAIFRYFVSLAGNRARHHSGLGVCAVLYENT